MKPYHNIRIRIKTKMIIFSILLISFVFLPLAKSTDCPYLGVPAGTNRTSDEVAQNTVVDYTCTVPGTMFRNGEVEYTVRCLPTGVWNKLPHPCQFLRCGHQHLIHQAALSTTSTLVGEEVTYRCMYGYSFPDGAATKVVSCNSTLLEWQPAPSDSFENMTCDAHFCEGMPPNLTTVFYDGLDAYTINKSIPIGSVITGYCDEGHEKSSSIVMATGKCAASGNLDGSYAECTVRRCPNLPVPGNSAIILFKDQYLRKTKYQCMSGVFPGGKSVHKMECDHNGQWKSEPSVTGCQVGGCEEGWIKFGVHCYFISDPTGWGLRYYYAEETCVHKKAHLASITTAEEGLFLYSKTYLISPRDYWMGYHYDTVTENWRWFGDENVDYTKWHKGYPELSQSCGRLSIEAVWKDRDCDDLMPYICKKPTMCESPPVIENGWPDIAVIPKIMDVGDSLIYKCMPGFSFRSDSVSEREVVCLPGTYYSAIENCQPTMCPPLNKIGYFVKNAAIVGSQASTYLNNVTWTCNPGFIFPDVTFSKVITCLPNRTWSSIPDMCIKVHCPSPAILNAIPQNYSSDVGLADIYTCELGFEFLTGEIERLMICQPDGTWIPDDSCWKKECQPYFHYNANITEGKTGVAKYQDKVEITCHVGYQFPDGREVKKTTCGPDYHWTPYLALCEPKTCPGGTPPDVPNAIPNTTAGIINTVVTYTCNGSYTFIDGDTERVAYCDLQTLQWIEVPTECLAKVPDQEDNFIGAGIILSTITAVAAITLIFILMWLIVCSDCNEDRKMLQVCTDCCENEDEEEEYSDDDSESPEQEPVRLQMVN